MGFKKTDLSAKYVGDIFVIREFYVPYDGKETNRKTKLKLECKCKCGQIFYPFKVNVTTGKTTKCQRCARVPNVIGTKMGQMQIIKRDLNVKQVSFICRCDCGWEGSVKLRLLQLAEDKRCIECRKPKPKAPKLSRQESSAVTNFKKHMNHREKMIGRKIHNYKILSFSHWKYEESEQARRRPWYNAKCKCGNIFKVRGGQTSIVQSCGCLQKERVPKGENNGHAKLTNLQAKSIRELIASGAGYTQIEIAKMLGITESVVSSIVRNKVYKD